MSRFMRITLKDIRRGQQSWRVYLALCGPSFLIAMFVVFQR